MVFQISESGILDFSYTTICRLPIGNLLVVWWSSVGQVSANSRPTVGQHLARWRLGGGKLFLTITTSPERHCVNAMTKKINLQKGVSHYLLLCNRESIYT